MTHDIAGLRDATRVASRLRAPRPSIDSPSFDTFTL